MLTAESVETSDLMALIDQLESAEQGFQHLHIDGQTSDMGESSDMVAEDFGYQALGEDEDELDEDAPEEYQYQMLPQDAIEESCESMAEPPVLVINPIVGNRIPDADLEVIRSVMQSFALPESAVPEWAKVVPEEKWMPKLDSQEENVE
ncbi:hypothetical protein K493DRAFT_315930 [Basidiobolus meristosporus CBS 931.73]|uniref:Male-enhanced antigen 1 n=1 Tax=Basidiobolus meristosporus CBS 931.73 TaxID=1314790 RepID=A0A1Y1Y6G6_9FUNG|nr:hypothetical protein K493DRAFT_315930 [Basidiobolus meristosporus CBS 931.73]|eukprot:ORX93559.1 hypothetical protein K493DRAFT_315930 [Basidiobolus meristosporus CBS 931.73]